MSMAAACCKRRRFPPAIVAHVVGIYLRFSPGLRAVQALLREHVIEGTDETRLALDREVRPCDRAWAAPSAGSPLPGLA